MAVKLIAPWHDLVPGDVVDRGGPTDEKLLKMGIAERIAAPHAMEKAVRQPKETRHGSA
jgi:hypothetical protein